MSMAVVAFLIVPRAAGAETERARPQVADRRNAGRARLITTSPALKWVDNADRGKWQAGGGQRPGAHRRPGSGPAAKPTDPVFAAWFTLNGSGEMTGTTWVRERSA